MRRVAIGQLSLDACPDGKRQRTDALTSTISVSGKLQNVTLDESEEVAQLDHGEVVLVTVSDGNGEVIASAHGRVQVGFSDKSIEGMEVTIREQKVKL